MKLVPFISFLPFMAVSAIAAASYLSPNEISGELPYEEIVMTDITPDSLRSFLMKNNAPLMGGDPYRIHVSTSSETVEKLSIHEEEQYIEKTVERYMRGDTLNLFYKTTGSRGNKQYIIYRTDRL